MPEYDVELQGQTLIIDAPTAEAAAREAYLRLRSLKPGEMVERPSEELLGREPEGLGKTLARTGGQLVKQSAMPMAGQLGGAYLGTLAGPLAPIAIPTMEALGGAGGEALNQALGVTEPSLGQIIGAGVSGPAARGIGYLGRAALRGGVRAIPGAAAPLNEAAILTARESMLPSFRPVLETADEWYQMLERAGNPLLKIEPLKDMATKLSRQQSRLANPDQQLTRELTDIGKRQGLVFNTLRERIKFWARKAEELEGTKSPSEGAYKALYAAGRETLEKQEGLAGFQAEILKHGNRVARREYLADDLTRMFEKATTSVAEGAEQTNWNTILSQIGDMEKLAKLGKPDMAAKRFVQSFESGELEALKKTLLTLQKSAPKIPPARGAMYGMGALGARGAVGGLAGYGVGGPEGMGLGTLAGIAVPQLLSKALLTKHGRAWAANVLAKSPTFDQPKLAALAGLARSFTANVPPEE